MYTFLPLGLRVLSKLEKIIDEEMQNVDGQKISMPCILSSDGWKKTGRWETTGAEMFKVKDRKGSEFCLAPTHEEEITSLVASEISSWKQLPLRLYQIGRKYRDEARPRSGLLRAREFVMKDMYSFDASEEAALVTYEQVRGAYDRILSRIGISFAAAEADTGNIGGTRSHEYHFLSSAGEDTVLSCRSCGYTANEERARGIMSAAASCQSVRVTLGTPGDRAPPKYAAVKIPSGRSVNLTKLKQHPLLKPFELALLEKAFDGTADFELADASIANATETDAGLVGDFLTILEGDICPTQGCGTPLGSHRAIEIGHTFFLGTRYSAVLNATIKDPHQKVIPIQMGCYGIGVTRTVAAVVEASHDDEGIKWPVALAPFRACVVLAPVGVKAGPKEKEATEKVGAVVCDVMHRWTRGDSVVDDREGLSVGFKVKDARLVGYPLLVVVGKKAVEGLVEVHRRGSGRMELVAVDKLEAFLQVD